MPRNNLLPRLVILLSLGAASSISAHELRLFVDVEGSEIVGRLHFEGGGPASGTVVQIINPRREIVAEVTTDAEGRFRQAMKNRADYVIRARTIDLHQAEGTIKADRFPNSLPTLADVAPVTHSSESVSDEAFHREMRAEIRLIREQLDRVESSIGLRDIVGGIGFIVGILGLLLFLRQRAK